MQHQNISLLEFKSPLNVYNNSAKLIKELFLRYIFYEPNILVANFRRPTTTTVILVLDNKQIIMNPDLTHCCPFKPR